MTSLKDFKVDENKAWFGDYWSTGVPKQIFNVEGAVIEPLFQGFMRCADERDFWDKDVCMAVFGSYIERVSFRELTFKPEYKGGVDITVEKLKQWCEENMARWKCPTYIEFIDMLPVITTGKVQRRLLQEKDISTLKEGKQIKG